jgi:hypothetical protein
MIEQLVDWCAESEALAEVRPKARSGFFGYSEPEPINYMDGAEDIDSRERRFLGWFIFSFELPDGLHPGELAASALLKEPELSSALDSIRNARYITAVVASVIPGRGFYLLMEDEEFEVESRTLSRILQKEDTLSLYILPAGHGRWLPGPGWLVWPIRLGPGMRSHLKKLQPSPTEVERFLQGRVKGEEELQKVERPQDATLEAATARMSQTAKAEGQTKLIMGPEEWGDIVLTYMMANDFNGFVKEITERAGGFKSVGEANKWLALATNIWNTTPQPDRGDKSAYQLVHQRWDSDVRYENHPAGGRLPKAARGKDHYKYMDYKMAQLIARFRGEAFDKLEQSLRRDIESKPLPVNTTLKAALNKLPAVWIDGICLCLAVPAERKKWDKVSRIASYLSDQASLARTIASLQPRQREALGYVLNCGGWVRHGQLSRRFGDETGDGWWWNENPPQSIIGQLRLHGLLFVGQMPIGNRHYKVAVIPGELRQLLLKALGKVASQKAKLPSRVADARFYDALSDQLSEIKLRYGTFATEDEEGRRYYERFMSYWSKTEYAKDEAAESFGVEEYLWNFRLPGSDKFLLDCFLEQRGKEFREGIKSGLLNWRGAELKCCRVVALKELLLLEDVDSGERMRCFSLSLGGVKDFRGSVGKMVISYISPWDDITSCLLGYSAILPPGKRSVKAYRELRHGLRDTTARTRRYFARPRKQPRSGLSEIPEAFLKAFDEEQS